MDKKKDGILKWETMIVALNFLFVVVNQKEGFRAFFGFILGAGTVGLLILKLVIKNEKIELFLNFIIGIVVIGFYCIFSSNTNVYFYFAFMEGLHFKNKKIKIISSIYTVSIYLFAIILCNLGIDKFNIINLGHELIIILSPYIGFCAIMIMIHIRTKDKKTIKELNKELIEQNKKLKEYSEQVEVLTLEKERNRVAQELHDSLGHYLMAISMHLNMLEKIKDEQKKKEVFLKTKGIVKDSIKELRETVYKLKEDANISFMKKINLLEEPFKEEIKFINNIDEKFENENIEAREALYITIKEAITNGIKHGNSKTFIIDINVDKKIVFSIGNDGISPKEIKMSNGLIGIRERIEKVNGWVSFEINNGFTMRGEIERGKND